MALTQPIDSYRIHALFAGSEWRKQVFVKTVVIAVFECKKHLTKIIKTIHAVIYKLIKQIPHHNVKNRRNDYVCGS